ncbi:hypothetical protein [Nonomuraea endophytica]|uniref:hypothetical protein n=1 Tax=Nonomuraea endophytica TaxID=714136 RepID=UPI0037CC2C1F
MALYHATKWGIEGFWESSAGDIAPFGVGVTLVRPGVARTAFAGGSADIAQAHAGVRRSRTRPARRRRTKDLAYSTDADDFSPARTSGN